MTRLVHSKGKTGKAARKNGRPGAAERGDHLFTLDYKSRKPLYDQLCESVERMAACGVLEEGSKLPSVRAMAEELAINPNTVQKAYRILEREGIIVTVPGKGSFLAGSEEARRRQRARGTEALRAGLQTALDSGLTGADIRQICADYLKESEEKA